MELFNWSNLYWIVGRPTVVFHLQILMKILMFKISSRFVDVSKTCKNTLSNIKQTPQKPVLNEWHLTNYLLWNKVSLLSKYKKDLFVRNNVLFSTNSSLAHETLVALRQEIVDNSRKWVVKLASKICACWTCDMLKCVDKAALFPKSKRDVHCTLTWK